MSSRRRAPSKQAGRRRAGSGPPPLRRILLSVGMGVFVFGLSSAFASSLSVTSDTLSSGNSGVTSCAGASSANVTYSTAYNASIPGYEVTTTAITSPAACAGKAYKVTLTDASDAAIAEREGTLDGAGSGSADFGTLSNVSAALVTGVSVVITG